MNTKTYELLHTSSEAFSPPLPPLITHYVFSIMLAVQ